MSEQGQYNPASIEPKWQAYWEENETFKTEMDKSKEKLYVLDMFPYPSGAGLHVGHPEGYTATDIFCRYKRMQGYNVLHPMGWDAFGLPAEQYAIKTGTHPAITTQKNCDNFRKQIKNLGLSYDWSREINTTDPKYFKWTQWIFKQLFNTWFDADQQKGRPISELPIPAEIEAQGQDAINGYIASRRLAYYDNAKVWWCNHCKTVCANEEILNDGSHEKCGTKDVERRDLKQWQLRIPEYGQRLLDGLDTVNWPEGIKEMQRNWIGKSTGAEVDFELENGAGNLRVYTTRPDTLFGATYMVVAPEHEIVTAITSADQKEAVEDYIEKAALKSDLERTELAKDKTGVFSGSYAINPINGEKIPVWIADYVLTGYGTGAIMAVPAHDTRDFEFAKEFDLPVICIMEPATDDDALKEAVLAGNACWTEDGAYIRSENEAQGLNINGLDKKQGVETVINWLVEKGLGESTVNFKLRDWLFSRQRYWGEPFPVIHWEDGSMTLVEDEDLPLELPKLEAYEPGDGGESPLGNAGDWLEVTCPKTGMKGRRETNTMPQWAGSCWYYLRYMDPHNENAPFDKEVADYWMPVDLYVGGAEHAVLHLLYSRFWHKVLFDLGIVSTDEPFQQLFNQGMILAFAYEDEVGSKIPADEVEERDGKFFRIDTDEEVNKIVAKMSKTLKNVVNPDDIVNDFGADSLRLYEMFMGPLDAVKPWNTDGVHGVHRFLQRSWRLIIGDDGELAPSISDEPLTKEQRMVLHQTIKKVTTDVESLDFNTAISQMMVFVNEFSKAKSRNREAMQTYVQLLAPFAPHLGEELWQRLGNEDTLTFIPWPKWNEDYLKLDEAEIMVQVNGKPANKIMMSAAAKPDEMETIALADDKVQTKIDGKQVRKVIAVPGRLVNIVAK